MCIVVVVMRWHSLPIFCCWFPFIFFLFFDGDYLLISCPTILFWHESEAGNNSETNKLNKKKRWEEDRVSEKAPKMRNRTSEFLANAVTFPTNAYNEMDRWFGLRRNVTVFKLWKVIIAIITNANFRHFFAIALQTLPISHDIRIHM